MELSTNDTPGGLPPTRSVEEVLGRIEAAIDDLVRLTGPEVLDGRDAPTVSQLADAYTRIGRLTGRLNGMRCTDC